MAQGKVTQHNGQAQKSNTSAADPRLHQRGKLLQQPHTVRQMPFGLPAETRQKSAEALNQLLADTIMLYNMYKKHHWQVAGPTFYQLHLLFDKHAEEQLELVDLIAERVQLLGGVAIGMPQEVAALTKVEPPLSGVEEVPVMIDRLLEAHQLIMTEARALAKTADDSDDLGTNDLVVSNVLRTNELQMWFVAEHVVDVPTVIADGNTRN